jgi:hypothetical protein
MLKGVKEYRQVQCLFRGIDEKIFSWDKDRFYRCFGDIKFQFIKLDGPLATKIVTKFVNGVYELRGRFEPSAGRKI